MSNDSIQIDYNKHFKPLEKLLAKVRRAGDFFASGAVEIPMPKVEIAGAGVLSFPVPPSQIAEIARQATRAPYGRGEETILDESVRKVWQVPPEKTRISGKSWGANFQNILQTVLKALGCEGMNVSAELYKILVYDTGGFFLPHRDTEKAAGMFGTLVLALPSAHCGGELVIRHGGRATTVDMSKADFSEVSFAAFYADCEHEVRPITQGNRICLVYNLIQETDAKTKGPLPAAPEYEEEIAAAAQLLEREFSQPGVPAKVAWLLEHQYSPDGLSFGGLKSADLARAKVLTQAAQRADCAAHLGIVHIEESGAAMETYHDYGWRGRRYDDDRDEEEETAADDIEVIEVCDSRHYIAQWRDPCDRPVDFGEIPLERGELLPAGALENEKPDQQRLMEASGNEGASFERSYHRAALVLWRRERYADVLLQAGVTAALPYLKERIEAATNKAAPVSERKAAEALARRVLDVWKSAPQHPGFRCAGRPEKRDDMLTLLTQLGHEELLKEFISDVVMKHYDGSENAALARCLKVLRPQAWEALFAQLMRDWAARRPGPCIDLLKKLLAQPEKGKESGWNAALRTIAGSLVGQLGEVKTTDNDVFDDFDDFDDDESSEPNPPDNKPGATSKMAADLLNALQRLGSADLRLRAAEQFCQNSAAYDPVTVLVPALQSAGTWDAATTRLWEHNAEFLLRRSARPPEFPKDWRQDVKLSCSCADCRELQAFTRDPVEQIHGFRVRKDRRQHLHQIIEKHRLDMTHETDRKGSPQTLVCTKDRRTYTRHCDQYRKDIAALAVLENLAASAPAPNDKALSQISAARSLAAHWSPG